MKFNLYTFGCRLNKAESNQIFQKLLQKGFFFSSQNPDLIIINSCALTKKAENQCLQFVKKVRRENSKSFLVLTGCLASLKNLQCHKLDDNLKTFTKKTGIDLLIANNEKGQIVEKILTHIASSSQVLSKQKTKEAGSGREFIKIQDGCNKFCTYCLVPFLRGCSQSIDALQIIEQAKLAEKNGIKEIILTGVDISQYQDKEGIDLTNLIKQILQQTQNLRIRLGSIYPEAFTSEFLALYQTPSAFAINKKDFQYRLCRHFHISLQSASDSVLQRMGRKYSVKEYLQVLGKIRQIIPDVSITTDVIVGFPGETNDEFATTFKNLQKMKLSKIHVFPYSERPLTKASQNHDWKKITKKTKTIRAKKLRDLSKEQEQDFIKKFLGSHLQVLLENKDKNGFCWGYSDNYLKVKVKKLELEISKIYDFFITDTEKDYLIA
ncbi:tRNA (N(6)-L-threonylcarbamoyladenosine(37)-C(2))-methylthiotransferase MtaB [Candidatus Beckwithbacteria bacterium]|nr:tRNA (N(6)-L-threonylcarbamoyladenosine(37)-C(2))-methylthiotransferase MtaB [Candidatus Beckwithbacteria bacterium]